MSKAKSLLLVVALAGAWMVNASRAADVAPASRPSAAPVSVAVSGGAMMNGDHFADVLLPVLREHFKGCRTIALVLHASHPKDFARMETRVQKAFEHLNGAKAESLHHYDVAGQRALLERADGIFVGGGETFVLLRELYRTGQLDVIRARVRAGVPYLGSSAGSNVAGLRIGTTNDFPVADVPSRDALGLLPVSINPHHPLPDTKADYDSRAGKIKIYLMFNPDETVLGLANAALVRLHAGRAYLASGAAWLYRTSGARELKVGETIPELSTAAKP